MNKLYDKIEDIRKYLAELEKIVPSSFREYDSSLEKKAACERYFERIVEAAIDICFMVIKTKNLQLPEDDLGALAILEKNKIIDPKLSAKLKDAKRMRNIIIHQYAKIDDKLVFQSIKEEIDVDINQFLKEVKKCLK